MNLLKLQIESYIKRFEKIRESCFKFENFDVERIKDWKWLLLELTPYLIIFIMLMLYKLNESYELNVPVIILPALLIAFLTFTNLAFCEGYCHAHYPKADIYCKNGRITKGIILKYGNYINLLNENKRCLINREDICYIEVRENSKKMCTKYFTAESLFRMFYKNKRKLEENFKHILYKTYKIVRKI